MVMSTVRKGNTGGVGTLLDRMDREDHFEEVTLELRSEGKE